MSPPCLESHKASRCERWEVDSRFIKSTSHPNSLVQIGKLRPSRQGLSKVTLSTMEPRESEPPRFGLAGLPHEGGLRRRGRRSG